MFRIAAPRMSNFEKTIDTYTQMSDKRATSIFGEVGAELLIVCNRDVQVGSGRGDL